MLSPMTTSGQKTMPISRSVNVALAAMLSLSMSTAFSKVANAQDFRIYTHIVDQSNPNVKAPVIARSLTLFHANKVYDYMDQLGELVVFEPSLQRFIVLNGNPPMKTEVPFPLLEQHLKVSEGKAREYLSENLSATDASAVQQISYLKFQLEPDFEIFDRPENRQLTLQSPHLTYQVTYSSQFPEGNQQIYFHYLNWMAKLNRILHPQAMLPAARLIVNQELEKRNCMPVDVTLRLVQDPKYPRQLKAEHQIQWELDKVSRTNINDWENHLKDPNFRSVSLDTYQKTLQDNLASASK